MNATVTAFTPVTSDTPVARTYNDIYTTAVTLTNEIERVLGVGHEMTLVAGAVVINLREGHLGNQYGPIVKATFCLGKLAEKASALAQSKTRKVSDDDKKYAQCWANVARELVGDIAARI